MSQWRTLLMESLRMLLARKVFWMSLCVSALLGVVYLSIELVPDGVTIGFGMQKIKNTVICQGTPEGEWFYITLFTDYINRFWLGSGALLLALLSTVSIFPEFLKEGMIELALSKPISRTRLFLIKYVGCLLFVALQTLLLAALVFVAIGWRLEYWNWSIFWVVPVLTFAFSLIHCVQVLVGVMTRSSMLALIVGLVFWCSVWLVQITEQTLYMNSYALPEEQVNIDWGTRQVNTLDEKPEVDPELAKYYAVTRKIAAPLPKVRDVTLSLDQLVRFRDSGSVLEQIDLKSSVAQDDLQYKIRRAERRTRERHSVAYVFLSSLAFECVVLALASFLFTRRDY